MIDYAAAMQGDKMDIENIQSNIENVEQEFHGKLRENEEMEVRISHLQDAISQLAEDRELAQSLSRQLAEREQGKDALEKDIDCLRNRASQLEMELQEVSEHTADSNGVLLTLAQLGEDTEEMMQILEERQRLIEECTIRLQEVIGQLGLGFLKSTGNSGNERSRSVGSMAQHFFPGKCSESGNESFCTNVELTQDTLLDSRFFSSGNHAEEFRQYWENLGDYTFDKADKPELIYVKARDVEGVYLNDQEVRNPEGFWTRYGLDNCSKDSILEKARNIPVVRARLEAGESIEDLMENPELKGSVSSYFDKPLCVARCGEFYVFQSDGRHRTLAAQSIDGVIPVMVIGEYIKREN